jgi:hypothetical protein
MWADKQITVNMTNSDMQITVDMKSNKNTSQEIEVRIIRSLASCSDYTNK